MHYFARLATRARSLLAGRAPAGQLDPTVCLTQSTLWLPVWAPILTFTALFLWTLATPSRVQAQPGTVPGVCCFWVLQFTTATPQTPASNQAVTITVVATHDGIPVGANDPWYVTLYDSNSLAAIGAKCGFSPCTWQVSENGGTSKTYRARVTRLDGSDQQAISSNFLQVNWGGGDGGGGGIDPPVVTTPSISASPNPVTNVSTTGTTTITFSTGNGTEGRVWLTAVSTAPRPPTPGEGGPINAPVPVLFASGASGSATATWIRTEVDYRFTLYKASDGLRRTPLASVTVTATAPPVTNPTITASPNPIPTGSSTSTISWNTGNSTAGQVWLSVNGAPEVFFDGGTSGSGAVSWFASGSSYRFTLYAGTARTTQLASVTVTVTTPLSTIAGITANPNPIPAGSGSGSSLISWSTGSAPAGQVWLSVNGAAEVLFDSGTAGGGVVQWFNAGNSYRFTLYAGTARATQLAQGTVTRAVTTGSISATPNPTSTGTTVISFDTNGNGDTGVVYVSINGGAEIPVWQNPRGVQSATWIDPGNTYVFRLYAGQGRLSSGVLGSVTVTR